MSTPSQRTLTLRRKHNSLKRAARAAAQRRLAAEQPQKLRRYVLEEEAKRGLLNTNGS